MQAAGEFTDRKFDPPGGVLVWLIISLELLTFIIAIAFFFRERAADLQMFREMQSRLDLALGTVNTILLISSGYAVAVSILRLRKGDVATSSRYLLTAMFFGALFLVIKSVEYHHKLDSGLTIRYHSFFTFYWLLTVFHFIHVVVGLGLLAVMQVKIRKGIWTAKNMENPETIAAFWHMCDLIWIILFPALYLVH